MNKIIGGFLTGLRYVKNDRFKDWVNAYEKATSITFQQTGTGAYGRLIYYIGMEDLGECEKKGMGFFALFNSVLKRLVYADRLGMLPYVSYPESVLYFDKEVGENVWEYYFEPVSDIRQEDVKNAYNLVISKEKDSWLNLKWKTGYEIDDEGIDVLSNIAKKYIRVNTNIQEYLRGGVDLLDIKNVGVLGVHIRGTDFKKGKRNHPIAVPLERYIEKAQEIFYKNHYSVIFLATDEDGVIAKMQDIFGRERVRYYQDTLRSIDGTPIHRSENNRSHHKYWLGCEVLRDAYTLAKCDGLIAGKSQVSLAVRILKKSWEIHWRDLQIIDMGMCK